MDGLLRMAWAKVFRLYETTPEPAWEPFWTRFQAFIPSYPMQ
eukprot:gene1925-9543_t